MAIVYGFGGLSHNGHGVSFEPRLPEEWDCIRFKVRVQGKTLHVDLTHETLTLHTDDEGLPVEVGGETHSVGPEPVAIDYR